MTFISIIKYNLYNSWGKWLSSVCINVYSSCFSFFLPDSSSSILSSMISFHFEVLSISNLKDWPISDKLLSFPLNENVFISSPFLQDSFAEYRINGWRFLFLFFNGWKFFYFSTLKILFKVCLIFWIFKLVFFDRFVKFSALFSSAISLAMFHPPHLFSLWDAYDMTWIFCLIGFWGSVHFFF